MKETIASAFSVENTENSSIIVSDAEFDTTGMPTLGSYLSMLHGIGRTVFGLYIPNLLVGSGEGSFSVSTLCDIEFLLCIICILITRVA